MNKQVQRRFLTGILAVLLLSGAAAGLSAHAEETEELPAVSDIQQEPEQITFSVNVTDERSPSGELTLGCAFTLRGVLTADQSLAKVYGGVYSADGGTAVQYHEMQPGGNVCDIHTSFDLQIRFGRLQPGSYLYRITAEDESGRTCTAIETSFSIVDRSVIPSDFSLVDASEPAEALPLGSSFTPRGKIFSTYSVMRIWGGIYRTDGSATELYFEDEPCTPTYSLYGRLGDVALFGELPAGEYVYRITACDLRGTEQVLIEKPFRIVEDDSAPSEIRLYNAAYPAGTQLLGRSFSVGGTVVSTYPLATVTGGIYRAEGSECDYHDTLTAEFHPDSTVFDLNPLDNNLPFARLPEGEYVYRVTATDDRGTTRELIAAPFRIRSLARSEDSPEVLMRGIDVSKHNGYIDWQSAYANGVDFAVMRIGVTSNSNANYQKDIRFEENYANARAAGVKVGVYLYTSAYNKAEIEHDIATLLSILDGRHLDMPIYIDAEAEGRQTAVGKAALTEVLRHGCELIREGGYQAGVYASYSWFKEYIDAGTLQAEDNEIWMAYWQSQPENYDYSDLCVTWQYSSSGRVSGLNGDVDRDLRYEALSADHPVHLIQPVGGTLTASKETAGCGERIRLQVIPDAGYMVKQVYYGELPAHKSGEGSYYFTMPDGEITVTAEMEEIVYTLVPEQAPTLEENGNTAYYTGSDGKYYRLENGSYTEIGQGSWVIPHLEPEPTEESTEPQTEAPTEPLTEAPTEPVTEQMPVVEAETAPAQPEVKLPQTGVGSGKKAVAGVGAAVLTAVGAWLLLRSRREDNDA